MSFSIQKYLFIFLTFILCISSTSALYAEVVKTTVITENLKYPWGMAFLPNGNVLITEREGRMRFVKDGVLDPEPIRGLPENLYVDGQGGLLDVVLHPDFAENNLVYFSYAGGTKDNAGTEVARAKLIDHQLENLETIFVAAPKTKGSLHYGSRLLFLPDNTLLITLGDRYFFMDEAQNIHNHLGTTIRINDDGSIPPNNPFIDDASDKPEIYTYGHRNIQGAAINHEDNSIWIHEHGPKGGDEINILRAGTNYGWPEITYGIDYSGAIISDKTSAPNMAQPLIYWDPSIAPSGMAFYNHDRFPQWKGHLFIGALVEQHLRFLTIEKNTVIDQERLIDGYGRIRDVEAASDGYIYILTDAQNGKLIRIEPK